MGGSNLHLTKTESIRKMSQSLQRMKKEMSFVPMTKMASVEETVVSLPPDTILSDFRTKQLLRDCDSSMLNENPADVWGVKGMVFSYASNLNDAIYCFNNAINNLNGGLLVKINYSAALDNFGQRYAASEVRLSFLNEEVAFHNPSVFTDTIEGLADSFQFEIAESILEKFKNFPFLSKEIGKASYKLNLVKKQLLLSGVILEDIKRIRKLVELVLQNNSLRVMEENGFDVEGKQVAYHTQVVCDVNKVMSLNDQLFDLIYDAGLKSAFLKFHYVFVAYEKNIQVEEA